MGGSEVQGHFWPHSKFEPHGNYMRPGGLGCAQSWTEMLLSIEDYSQWRLITGQHIVDAVCRKRRHQGVSFLQEAACASTWLCGFTPKRQESKQRKPQPFIPSDSSSIQFSFLDMVTHIP